MNLKSIIRLALFQFVFVFPSQIFSQVFSDQVLGKIDSLNQIFEDPNAPDTTKANSYIAMANYYYAIRPDTAILFCEKGREISEKIDYERGKSESYSWLAYLYNLTGDPYKAFEFYEVSLPITIKTGTYSEIAVTVNNMGDIYNSLGEMEQALNYYYKAQELYAKGDDNLGVGITKINIGTLSLEIGDTTRAIENFNSSLDYFEPAGYKFGLAYSYGNLGSLHFDFGEYDKALEYFDQSSKLRREVQDYSGLGIDLNNIGTTVQLLGNPDSALIIHKEALEINESTQNANGIANSHYHLSVDYYELKKYELAKFHAELALKLSTEQGLYWGIMQTKKTLGNIYAQLGNGMKAIVLNNAFYAMRDSIANLENQKLSIEKETAFEYEKKKVLDDAAHEKELAIKDADKKRRITINYFAIGGVVLIGLFLLFVFNRLRITRKQKNIIEEQKEEVEQQKSKIEEVHKEITDSISYAKRIQTAILPPDRLIKKHLSQSFVLYLPKDVVAGDFYWFEETKKGVFLAAADCTGHGVPGAMVSVVCNNALNRAIREYGMDSPGEVLNKTREIVIQEFEKSDEDVKDGMDIALCKFDGLNLQYAGAHNPLWIVKLETNELIEIKANKQPIGKFENSVPYQTHHVELAKGDTVYMFSDGFPDQFGGERGKKFKSKNLKSLLVSIQHLAMNEQQIQLETKLKKWQGSLEQVDDICLIGVKV